MNHHSGTSADITMQYVQFSVETLREPAEKIAQFILKCAGELKTADVVALGKSGAGGVL
jgi:hypothetical protein